MSDDPCQMQIPGPTNRIVARVVGTVATTLALLVVARTLGACGTPTAQASVRGTVTYPQATEAAPGAELIVEIRDVSAADAIVVGEQRIPDPGTGPIAFEVKYDAAAIEEGHEYVVQARVEDSSGSTLYTTMQTYGVITLGHPTENVQVVLEMLGGALPLDTAPIPGTSGDSSTVRGTVSYAQPTEPAQGTVLIVEIRDVSTVGSPVIAGEQRISDPGPSPVAFEVAYDPAAIDEGHEYIVHARVEDANGNLLYTTMQNYAVITLGRPTQNLQITLEVVGGTSMLPSSGRELTRRRGSGSSYWRRFVETTELWTDGYVVLRRA